MTRKERKQVVKDAVQMAHLHTTKELIRIRKVAKIAYKLRKVVDEYTDR